MIHGNKQLKTRRARAGFSLFGLLFSFGLQHAATAQPAPQPAAPAKTFDGWVLECNDQGVCQALQSIVTKINDPAAKPEARPAKPAEGGKAAASSPPRSFTTLVAVRKLGDGYQLLLELPFGVALAKGATAMVDGNPSYTIPFYTCYQRGCVVQHNLDSKQLNELRTGKFLNLSFVGIESDNWRWVGVPLKGLNQALGEIK
jgi:invasion protein IalB